MLARAVYSVATQTHPAVAHSIAIDRHHEGAWVTRQRALDAARTPWVQFLDDDDVLYENHLERLLACANDTGADYVFSYWDITKSMNVFATPDQPMGHLGRVFDPAHPHHTTMTVLVRTALAQSVGFTAPPDTDIASGEDWRFLLDCVKAGASIVHLPEQTWYWCHHAANTSGQPFNWK